MKCLIIERHAVFSPAPPSCTWDEMMCIVARPRLHAVMLA